MVQAAGTDAWAGLRQAVARWFGRGDVQREQTELERLDQTVAELAAGDGAEAERVRIRQEVVWQTRIEGLLESLDERERMRFADELRTVLAQHAPQGEVSADRGGLAIGGDVEVRADHGSAAAVRMGDVTVGNPPVPGSHQG